MVGFSRETVLATNGMLALASCEGAAAPDARSVAATTGGGVSETCQVLDRLERAGLVKVGRNGAAGFAMTRAPERVSLYEVARAVGETFACCLECREPDGAECANCPLSGVCAELRDDVITLFKQRTIGDLLQGAA
jgi:DNA-binding IscR family transcriptional regulator